jgi:hypothetical protein
LTLNVYKLKCDVFIIHKCFSLVALSLVALSILPSICRYHWPPFPNDTLYASHRAYLFCSTSGLGSTTILVYVCAFVYSTNLTWANSNCLSSCDWTTSSHILPSSFTHVKNFLTFESLEICQYMYRAHFVYLFILLWCLYYFHILGILNNEAINCTNICSSHSIYLE